MKKRKLLKQSKNLVMFKQGCVRWILEQPCLK